MGSEVLARNQTLVLDLGSGLWRSWFYGVMAITLDFESNNPSSNLGRTYLFCKYGQPLSVDEIRTIHVPW